jgi:hypothetical protein
VLNGVKHQEYKEELTGYLLKTLSSEEEDIIYQMRASLCEKHHIMAEETTISCDEIRIAAGINHSIIPPHFYGDLEYTKWGDIVLPNGTRLKARENPGLDRGNSVNICYRTDIESVFCFSLIYRKYE